ncbi:DM4/DM12 family [Popillia japonica]|uniref:DM4/DM12 family n=1 Tax=Popillia japonica TaxID=7064 RepID=A0AAW1JHE7_POPJA
MTKIMQIFLALALFSSSIIDFIDATPKKYHTEDGNFQPSNIRYFESELSPETNKTRRHDQEAKDSDRLERFGYISSFGNTANGNTPSYGTTGVGNPVKIDIGGIAIGALIGLGAVLIIPKLAHLFSSNYGYRSLDDSSTVTDVLSKLDNALEEQHIDSTSCMQRIICSYVHEAQKNVKNSEASTTDQIIYSLSNNSLFTFMLDGSSIKQAVDMGKRSDPEKCANLYMKCPVSKENIRYINFVRYVE